MNIKIKKHLQDLHIIDNQRKGWLFLSGFVALTVAGIIFGWSYVQEFHLIWLIVSLGLLISMIWWYWTMRLVRHLISYKITESEILTEIVQEIRYIKTEVIKDLTKPVDKDK